MGCKLYFENKKITPFDTIEDAEKMARIYSDKFVRIVKLNPEFIDPDYRHESDVFVLIHVGKRGGLRCIDEDGSFSFKSFDLEKRNELFEYIDKVFINTNSLSIQIT